MSTPYLPLTDVHIKGRGPRFNETSGVDLPGAGVRAEIARVTGRLRSAKHDKLAKMFEKCFPNTLETTVKMLEGGGSYVITGDIDLMWLRDSSAQVHQYLSLHEDPTIRSVVEGVIKQQMFFIPYSPYGSSFRVALRPEDDLRQFHTAKGRNVYTSMHNYELDSLCYPIWLSYQWWQASGRTDVFTDRWRTTAWLILDLFQREQRHFIAGQGGDCKESADQEPASCYRYTELPNDRGRDVAYTGMIWSGFRPSDDQQQYGYLIPSNMFAVVVLGHLTTIATEVFGDNDMATLAKRLRKEVDDGIHKHGVVPGGDGPMYAYEVDGKGGVNKMDDANVPSLLSIRYLGYKSPFGADPDGLLEKNTRQFVLSKKNPTFHVGSAAEGIGSPHTGSGTVWPMAIVMRGLTTTSDRELATVFKHLQATDAGKNFMHESFNPNNPGSFSRAWFAWANSLFSELVIEKLDWLVQNPAT